MHTVADLVQAAIGEILHCSRYAQDWIIDPEFPLILASFKKGVFGSGTHGDINAHIIDLGHYLVGEFKRGSDTVQGQTLTSLDSTRYARGRKNHIEIEINVSWAQ